MGNHRKGTPPRPATQPEKLLLSGDTSAIAIGGGKNGAAADTFINIKLIQIDLGVAAQVEVGDFVQIEWHGSHYEANFNGQRLGNVPGNYNATLLPELQLLGSLVKVAIYADPINMVVRVKLPINHQ